MKKLFSSLFGSTKDGESFEKYLVVPDLHGTYSVWQRVETYIRQKVEKERAVIFLGDYMDRGESGEIEGRRFNDAGSYYTIRDIIALSKWAEAEGRRFIFLRGNHEIFFENFFIDGSITAYRQYPFFKDSVQAIEFVMQRDPSFTEDFLRFLRNLRPYFYDRKRNYLFVHAGIDPSSKDLDEQVRKGSVYWIRDKFILSNKKLPYKKVIFGHTPFFEPFLKKEKIGLDCGVYRTGHINLLQIDGEKFNIFNL